MPAGTSYGIAINPDTKITDTVSVGSAPHGIAVTPDGTKVYVANSGSNGVSIIDTSTDKVVATLNVGVYPWGVAVTPDGIKVYVANSGSNDVSVIDVANNTVVSTVPAGNSPYGVTVGPDGKKVYVTNHNSSNISVIDTVNNCLIKSISVGSGPYSVAVNPEGTNVYVANYNSNNISVISTITNNVTETINVGENPEGIAVSPDGKKVYVANSGSNNVSVIDISTNNTTSVYVGSLPAAFGQFIGYFPTQSPENESIDLQTPLPVANFSSNVTGGYAPLSVQFTDISENAKKWVWDFGDGSGSTQRNEKHIYSRAGNYNITLTVSNAHGADSKTGLITVLPIRPDPEPVFPVADFISNVTSGKEPLDVIFTDISTENPTAWNWNFGDGTYSSVKNPVHRYSTKGDYNVMLTVSNADGTDSKTGSITVTPGTEPVPIVLPVANFSGSVTQGYAPLSVQFIDLSQNAVSWNWEFGDGATSTEQNPKHSYSMPGNYTVDLTASNPNGADSKTAVITLLEAEEEKENETSIFPVADLTMNKTSGYCPLIVLFTDTSQNATLRSWDVNGDGLEDSNETSFVYEYATPGNYTVNLTAANEDGTDSKTGTIIVLEKLLPPIANFSSNVTQGYAPLTVQFTDLSENATEWSWNFGDGINSTDQSPAHTYPVAGKYTIILTVTSVNGTDSKNATIKVCPVCYTRD